MRRFFPAALIGAALALSSLPGTASAEGDVAAFVTGSGDLMVVGDELSNGVFVGRTGEPDEFRIEGFERGGAATTVNGLSSVVLEAPGGKVTILLGEGDDQIHLDGNLPGSVTIRGGPGGDWIQIGCPTVPADLDIDTGPGNDLVDMQESAVDDDLTIRTGTGSDRVFFFFAFIHGDTSIDTGSGADEVDLDDSSIGGDLSVRSRSGDDSVEIAETIVGGRARFDGGPDSDTYSDGGGNDFQGGAPRVSHFE